MKYMEDFLKNCNLKWNSMPKSWGEGAFLGNGLIGAMIYGDSECPLLWNLGRTDVYDVQQYSVVDTDQYRVPLGKLAFLPKSEVIGFQMELDLWNAEVKGELKMKEGTVSFLSFVPTGENIIVIEMESFDMELTQSLAYVADYPLAPLLEFARESSFTYEEMAKPAIYEFTRSTQFRVQPLKSGGDVCIAINEKILSRHKRIYFISIGMSSQKGGAKEEAISMLEYAKAKQMRTIQKVHRNWWHNYYPQSFLTIPDKEMEAFYWIQMYKLASATRKDCPMMDLMGPWPTRTVWAGIWWNLNTQLAYWPIYTSNRLELGQPLCDTLDMHFETLNNNAPEEYRKDAAMIGRASGRKLVSINNVELCNLPWLCHNYWLQYRYSMDDDRLRNRLFPLLKRSMNYYIHFLEVREDGKYHLAESVSPEYGKTAKDSNINLALLQWGCKTLLDSCSRLKIHDALETVWQDILDRMVEFPMNENGLMIGENVPFDESHRHFSHLLAIYPLYLMHRDRLEDMEGMKKSIDHWCSLDEAFAGYSYTAAASLYAAIGDGDNAFNYLKLFLEKVPQPNTMYLELGEGGPTIETPLSFTSSLHEMLLQSWGGKIRIFPAIPTKWNNISFHNLRTEGAFLVSAVWENGYTTSISIKSLAGEPCIIEFNMIEPIISIEGKQVQYVQYDAKSISVALEKGQVARIVSRIEKS